MIELPCFLEPVRLSVHVHQVRFMGQSVHECVNEDFVLDDLPPPVKREVRDDDGGLRARPQREVVEEQLPSFLVTCHIPEFVTDDEVVASEPCLQRMQLNVQPLIEKSSNSPFVYKRIL